jgi:hypothetical protein
VHGAAQHAIERHLALQGGTKFTREELRDLFQLNEATDCNTRDLLAQLPGGADWQVRYAGMLAAGHAAACSPTPLHQQSRHMSWQLA